MPVSDPDVLPAGYDLFATIQNDPAFQTKFAFGGAFPLPAGFFGDGSHRHVRQK
jgi:hypothetical protein